MDRTKLVAGAVAAMGVAVLAATAALPAHAQDDGEPDDVLDELRDLIPQGEPGEYDLTQADIEFEEFVVLFGETTEVADFGDGSTLSGPCGGFAHSYDENGDLLDAAYDLGGPLPPFDPLDGEQAFTSGNPFKVDTRGVVVYYGFAPRVGDGPLGHDWFIRTSGISLDEGGDPNTDGENRNTGLVDLDEDLPVKFSAKVKVEGELNSDNLESCIGQGHVEFVGNGLLDPVGIGGLVLLGGGIFGLLFNARPARTWKE